MFVLDIIKNPFFWLILVLIITVIVYFVLNKPTPNIRTTCTSDQELIDGKCLDKCGVGRIRCGTTTTCYDPNQQYCDSRSQVCSISNKNCNKCCPDGSSCQNGVCTTCPVNLKCGTKCCDDASQCCNNNECCTKDAVCTKDGCCEPPNTVCGDECCNVSAGLVCVDGKCQIGCPAPDPITKKLPDGFTGTPVACDPNTSVCFQNPTIKDINQQYQCLPTGCGWGDFSYTPPQDYTDSNGTPVHVCGDPNGNLWISKNNMTDLTSSVNVNIKNFDPDKCTNDTCFQKIYQAGSTELKGLKVDDLKAGKITGNTCSSELLCGDILIPFDQNKLRNICEDPKSSLYSQCCYDNNNEYSGQICPPGFKCHNSTCYKIGGKDGCSNNGVLQLDGSCKCDPGYAGNRCQVGGDFYCGPIEKGYLNPDGSCTMRNFNVTGTYATGISGSKSIDGKDVCCPTAHDCLQFSCPEGTTNSKWDNIVQSSDVADMCFSNKWVYPTCSGTWPNPHPNPAPNV